MNAKRYLMRYRTLREAASEARRAVGEFERRAELDLALGRVELLALARADKHAAITLARRLIVRRAVRDAHLKINLLLSMGAGRKGGQS